LSGAKVKKEAEERVAKLFARTSGEIVEASVVSVAADPPDIEALLPSGSRVAIELTGYYMDMPLGARGGSALRAAQGQQETIAHHARTIFEERNGMLPLVVEPGWAGNRALPLSPDDTAHRIARVVEGVIAGKTRPKAFEFLEATPTAIAAAGLPHELEELSILWGEGVTQAMWESGFAGPMDGDPHRFAQLITKKAGRRPSYASRFDEAWLLITVDMDGFGEISSAVTQASYNLRGFERVYFFDSIRLQVCRATELQGPIEIGA
jgi:hypothetical protein